MNIVTWSGDQHIRIHELELGQFLDRETDKASLKRNDESDIVETIVTNTNRQITNPSGLLQLYSNTTNSSRKSSLSEYTAYGTSPNPTGLKPFNQERDVSFNILNDDQESTIQYVTAAGRNTSSISICNPHGGALKSSSSSLAAHEFLKKYPKSFGAKFSGLPG